MKISPQTIWNGLSKQNQVAVAAGVYDEQFPNLKQFVLPVIADDTFVDVLGSVIAVDTTRTDA